jgi:CRP-like cAMP-binding protein
MMSYRPLLKRCPVFAGLTGNELDQIAEFTTEREYASGVTLFNAQEPSEELLVLEEGTIALQVAVALDAGTTSRKITIDIVNPYELVGWSAVVEPYIYNFTGISLQPCKVLVISGKRLRRIIQNDQNAGYEILQGLIKVVSERLADTRQMLVSERIVVPAE